MPPCDAALGTVAKTRRVRRQSKQGREARRWSCPLGWRKVSFIQGTAIVLLDLATSAGVVAAVGEDAG